MVSLLERVLWDSIEKRSFWFLLMDFHLFAMLWGIEMLRNQDIRLFSDEHKFMGNDPLRNPIPAFEIIIDFVDCGICNIRCFCHSSCQTVVEFAISI